MCPGGVFDRGILEKEEIEMMDDDKLDIFSIQRGGIVR